MINIDSHHHHNATDPLYWILFFISFVGAMAGGVKHYIGDIVHSIELPVHDIWWLPQLPEAIPTMILAILVAACSFITNQILHFAWKMLRKGYSKLLSKTK